MCVFETPVLRRIETMLTVSKTFEFAASHRLFRPQLSDEENVKLFGKCATQHGHNYLLEVSVSGPIDPGSGMVVDARELERIVVEHVFRDVDHRDLVRDVPWLNGIVTTVEGLTEAIWSRLDAPFAAAGVALDRIRLWETRRIYAEKYREGSR